MITDATNSEESSEESASLLEELAECEGKGVGNTNHFIKKSKPLLANQLHLTSGPGNFIFVFGGVGEPTKLSTILRYDIAQNKWEDTKTPLHINRGGVFYDKDNQIITILGGKKETQFVTKVYNLNPVNNDLQVLDQSPLKMKRSGFGFLQTESKAPLQDMMFIIGGNDGECILKSVICIKFDADDLVSLADMCIARDELGVAIDSRGCLYAVGGFGSSLKTCLRSVEAFDPHAGEWKVIAEMNCARRGCSCVVIDESLYIIGGFDGETYIQEMEM